MLLSVEGRLVSERRCLSHHTDPAKALEFFCSVSELSNSLLIATRHFMVRETEFQYFNIKNSLFLADR
jgi:hypothetical protein